MHTEPSATGPRRIQRHEAIANLRATLLKMTDDEHSICRVATERGIFCHGFANLTDEELRKRYRWIVERYPTVTRVELERIANLWQLSRQLLDGVPLACDVQKFEHDTCNGWDDFSNDELERFHRELCEESVRVVA